MVLLDLEDYLKKKIKDALVKSALIVEAEAVMRCPVDTGRMRSSIHIEYDSKGAVVVAGVDYAKYPELGTKAMEDAHGIHDPKKPVQNWKAKRKRGGGAGQTMPFMSSSLYNNRFNIVNIFKKEIESKT